MTRYARRQLVVFDVIGEVFGLVVHDEGEDGARLANFDFPGLQSLRRRFVLSKSSESVLGTKLLPHIQTPGAGLILVLHPVSFWPGKQVNAELLRNKYCVFGEIIDVVLLMEGEPQWVCERSVLLF